MKGDFALIFHEHRKTRKDSVLVSGLKEAIQSYRLTGARMERPYFEELAQLSRSSCIVHLQKAVETKCIYSIEYSVLTWSVSKVTVLLLGGITITAGTSSLNSGHFYFCSPRAWHMALFRF